MSRQELFCHDTAEVISKRKVYNSLDEMAQDKGVIAVLEFLAHNPTIILDKVQPYYRHTNIPVVPFTVTKL